MKRKTTAVFFAAVLAALPLAPLHISAEPLPADWQPPEWVPTDFLSAMQFNCTYGATHIQDGKVCIVHQESTREDLTYSYSLGGTVIGWTDWCDYPEKTYELVLPDKPESTDAEAYRKYEQALREIGLDTFILENNPDYKAPFRYTVYLFDTVPDTTLEVTINAFKGVPKDGGSAAVGQVQGSVIYTFETDQNGKTVETDWRGWLPDCVKEHKAFNSKYGALSLHQDQYIVYCDDVCYDGGIDVIVTQEPEDALEVWKSYNLSDPELMEREGGMGHHVCVFKAAKTGDVNLTIIQKQPWAGEDAYIAEKETGSYSADETGKIKEIDPPTPEPPFVPTSKTADAVLKYLNGEGELDAETAKNADMDKNGSINANDLTMIKRYLLSPEANETLTLIPPAGNVTYQPGPGADFTMTAIFSAKGSYEWLENATVALYNPKTDMEILKLKPVKDADSVQWAGKMHYNIDEDCDKQFYAKLTAETGNPVAPKVEIKSDLVTVHFSNESNIIDYTIVSPTLETRYEEVGFGGKPEFVATLSQDGWFSTSKVMLINADTGKEICEMELVPKKTGGNDSGTKWACTADLNVQEDTTMKFNCSFTAYDNAGKGLGTSYSNTVSVHFCETPAP